jgi:hypothetical protein
MSMTKRCRLREGYATFISVLEDVLNAVLGVEALMRYY